MIDEKYPLWFKVLRCFELFLLLQLPLGMSMILVAPDFINEISIVSFGLFISAFFWQNMRWEMIRQMNMYQRKS